MGHVFVSYVKEDRTTVQRLVSELQVAGVSISLDRKSLAPGTRWKAVIRRAIHEGDYFVACFSKSYNQRNKTYMNEKLVLPIDELRQYSANRSWLIPVLLTRCDT